MCVRGDEDLGEGLGVLFMYCVNVCDCMNAYVQVSVCTFYRRGGWVCTHARVWQ